MRIEHAALYVKDLARARAFYVTWLQGAAGPEYHNPRTDFRSCFITFVDGARLELMHRPGLADAPASAARTGYDHVAFSTGSRERVDELTARLRDAGFTVVSGPRTTGDGYYESCVLGTEGNRIELTI